MPSEDDQQEAPKKKKINTTAIGNATALKAKKLLEARRYSVAPARKGRAKNYAGFWFSYGEDFFGVFDAIAVNENGDMRFLQFTTQGPNTHPAARASKLVAWGREHSYATWEQATIELWTWIKRKGFQIETLKADYTWSKSDHYNSSVSCSFGGAPGDNGERRAASGGKSSEPASPTPKEKTT